MGDQLGYTLFGVREHTEEYPVELVRRAETDGRLSVRARNEGGNNETLIDLWDLVDWLRLGPEAGRTQDGFCVPAGEDGETVAR